MESIKLQLGKVAQLLDLRIETVVKKVGLDIFTGCVQRTPVDTGRARASWEIGIDQPGNNPAPANPHGSTNPLPGASADAAMSAMQNVDVRTNLIYITNALDYVQYLEGGSSKQAPAGMVMVTVEAIKAEVDAVIDQAVQEHPDI